MRRPLALALSLALSSGASAQISDPPELGPGPEHDCVAAVSAALAPAHDEALPELDRAACLARLDSIGVAYEPIEDARGVGIPVRLRGAIEGVEVRHRGGSALHEIIDCRLAAAIAEWAPALREAGVARLEHLSIYRPGAIVAGSRRVSGHAKALAIDVGFVILDDGSEIDVLNGWEERSHGADPCGRYEESEPSARLRGAVCAAVRAGIFQVVLTPHHDRAHQNHLHLELVPGVDWSFVH